MAKLQDTHSVDEMAAAAARRAATAALGGAGRWPVLPKPRPLSGGSDKTGRRSLGGLVGGRSTAWADASADAACCSADSLCAACLQRCSNELEEQQQQQEHQVPPFASGASSYDSGMSAAMTWAADDAGSSCGSPTSACGYAMYAHSSAPMAVLHPMARVMAVPVMVYSTPWQAYACMPQQALPASQLEKMPSPLAMNQPALPWQAAHAAAAPPPLPAAKGTGVFLPKMQP